jgi:hypothetical protein
MDAHYEVKEIVHEVQTNDPYTAAMWTSTFLAADKGVPNEVRQEGDCWLVVTDDGKAARYHKMNEPTIKTGSRP